MEYNKKKAEEFWTNRVKEVDELRAVLSYNAPRYVNEAYDKWEISTLLKSLGKVKNKKILDIACGVGRVTIPLLELGAYVYALDNSKKMLDITNKKAIKKNLAKNLKLIKSSADEIGFNNNFFDVIVCVGLLEHLPSELKVKVLEEIIRMLKPKSASYLIINNKNSIFLNKNHSYSQKEQSSDGYYVSLIGMDFIEKYSKTLGYTYNIISSNILYSFFRNKISELTSSLNDETLGLLFNYAFENDLSRKKIDHLDEIFSDQFLVKLIKQN